jgi:hypothetical protein
MVFRIAFRVAFKIAFRISFRVAFRIAFKIAFKIELRVFGSHFITKKESKRRVGTCLASAYGGEYGDKRSISSSPNKMEYGPPPWSYGA